MLKSRKLYEAIYSFKTFTLGDLAKVQESIKKCSHVELPQITATEWNGSRSSFGRKVYIANIFLISFNNTFNRTISHLIYCYYCFIVVVVVFKYILRYAFSIALSIFFS